MAQPWERLDTETGPSWEAFQTYRDLPPANRSIATALSTAGKAPGNRRQWERWSSQHDWTERARAWDAYLDLRAQEVVAKRTIERKKRQADMGQQMLSVAAIPGNELARRLKEGTLDLKGLSVKELLQLQASLAASAKAGADLWNLASDDVTDRQGVRLDPHLERLRALVDAEASSREGGSVDG